MFAIYHFTSPRISLVCLILGGLLFIPIDILRLARPRLNAFAVRIMGPIIRQHEVRNYAGTTYLIVGVMVIYFTFPKPVVELCLLFLAFGDPLASLCGILWGRDKIFKGKTLQGAYGAFAACTIAAVLYFYLCEIMTERLWLVSLLSGLVGAVAELIPVRKLDDNLTFPIFSALGLSLIFYLFGGFSP